MGQHEDERAGEDRDDIIAVIARCVSKQPEIHMRHHEGYYRHSDISTLIRHVTIPKPSATDFDEWCDALGRAARDDYTAVPHSVLAKWFTRGDSVEVAVGNFIDYRMSHPA